MLPMLVVLAVIGALLLLLILVTLRAINKNIRENAGESQTILLGIKAGVEGACKAIRDLPFSSD
jgi:hypothetical protein